MAQLIEELREINQKLEKVIDMLKAYQSQKLSTLETDEDIKEYRTLKEAIDLLKDVA